MTDFFRSPIHTIISTFTVSMLVSCSDFSTHEQGVSNPISAPEIVKAEPLRVQQNGSVDLTRIADLSKLEEHIYSFQDPIRGDYEKTEEFAERLERERRDAILKFGQEYQLVLVDVGLNSYDVEYDPDNESIRVDDDAIYPPAYQGFSLKLACAGGPGSGYSGDQLCASVKLQDALSKKKISGKESYKIPMSPHRARELRVGQWDSNLLLLSYVAFDYSADWLPLESQNKSVKRESKSPDIDTTERRYSPFYSTEIMYDRSTKTKYKSAVLIGEIKGRVLVDKVTGEILRFWE